MHNPAYFDTASNRTHLDTATFRCEGSTAESAFIAVISRGLGLPLAYRAIFNIHELLVSGFNNLLPALNTVPLFHITILAMESIKYLCSIFSGRPGVSLVSRPVQVFFVTRS